MKTLNWICQFWTTSNFVGVSGAYLKLFKIPIYRFILVTLYRTLCHTCYCYISVKFPRIDLLGQYISDFYLIQKMVRDQRSKNYAQMAPKASCFIALPKLHIWIISHSIKFCFDSHVSCNVERSLFMVHL